MLALLGADQQADVVPFAGGFGRVQRLAGGGIDGGLVELIEAAAALRGGGLLVVLELKLRPALPRVIPLVGGAEHEAAIPALRDVVVGLKLKPIVLVVGEN